MTIRAVRYDDDTNTEPSQERIDALIAWAEANAINPSASVGELFVDLGRRTVHWMEIVPPKGARPHTYMGRSWPQAVRPGNCDGPGSGLAEMGDVELVVSRTTPLLVDPPELIMLPVLEAVAA